MNPDELLIALMEQQLQLTEQIHALTQAISLMAQTNQLILDALAQPGLDEDEDDSQTISVYMDGSRQ